MRVPFVFLLYVLHADSAITGLKPCGRLRGWCRLECGRREIVVRRLCPAGECCPAQYRCCLRSPNDVYEPIRTPRRTPTAFYYDTSDSINWPDEPRSVEESSRLMTNSVEDTSYALGIRAAKYCKKYSRFAFEDFAVNPLRVDLKVLWMKARSCPPKLNPLVVGGKPVGPGEFPHLAALGFRRADGEVDYLCGGTLVSDRMVLTVAHCTETKWGKPEVVQLGSTELYSNSGVTVNIVDSLVHPEYKPPAVYHDIALIMLAETVKLSGTLRPACLPTPITEAQVPGSPTVAAGWGKLGFGRESSNWLMKVSLEVVGNKKCQEFYTAGTGSLPVGITPSLLCASGSGSADTCQGDSGGPLQASGPHYCTVEVVGITSFGKSCGAGVPGVYTRVTSYLSWLEDILWPHG